MGTQVFREDSVSSYVEPFLKTIHELLDIFICACDSAIVYSDWHNQYLIIIEI